MDPYDAIIQELLTPTKKLPPLEKTALRRYQESEARASTDLTFRDFTQKDFKLESTHTIDMDQMPRRGSLFKSIDIST